MTPTSMRFNKLSFVKYDKRFLDHSYVWFQDEELRGLTNTPVVTREAQAKWFQSLSDRRDYIIWGVELDHAPIGACGLRDVTSTEAVYWGYIGERQLWGKGLGKQIVRFCLDQAKLLGLLRVRLVVNAENERAAGLYQGLGFKVVKHEQEVLEMEVVLVNLSAAFCDVISFPKQSDPRGNLTFIEGGRHVPFDIKRVFYLYDVPGGADRGGHALRTCHQVLIAVSGSFDVVLDDGMNRQQIHLNRSYYGVHVPPMIWRELKNFSSGSVCLVLASERYEEKGYLRTYEAFLNAAVEADHEHPICRA